METSASSAAPSPAPAPAPAPRLRLTLVNDDDGADAQKYDADVDSNSDPPAERQADAPAAPASRADRAEAYLEQEGQKASHVFAGLTPDPDAASSSESDTSSSEDIWQRSLSMARPASLVLDCPCPSSTCKILPFRYGGLELRVNSRSVEVYITEQSTGEDKYVVTSRGVKDGESESNNKKVEWHKFVIVNRGGPATVTSVKIRAVSIKPADCDAIYVSGCKVKAKLLSTEEAKAAVAGGEGINSNGITTPQRRAAPQAALSPVGGGMSSMAQMMMAMGGGMQPQQQPQSPAQPPSMAALMAMMGGAGGPTTGIPGMPATPADQSASSSMPSHADMGMAISALRTMVSSTEESINRRIIENTQQLDASMAARIKGLESKVTRLTDRVEEQNEVILRQRSFIVEQGDALTRMEAKQNAMLEKILEGQSKLMDELAESSRQSNIAVESCDEESGKDAVLRGSAESHTTVEAATGTSLPKPMLGKEVVEATNDLPVAETQQNDTIEIQLDDDEAMVDPKKETIGSPPVMTYRGAENLISFEEGTADDNTIPGSEQVETEAISDLLMSTVTAITDDD